MPAVTIIWVNLWLPSSFFKEFTVFENCFLKSHYFISSSYIYKEEVKDISFTEDLKFETGPCSVGEAGSKLPLYLLACP